MTNQEKALNTLCFMSNKMDLARAAKGANFEALRSQYAEICLQIRTGEITSEEALSQFAAALNEYETSLTR